jgi:hypothetical protein
VQQAVALGNVVNMACRAFDGMHQPRVGISADVGLHAKVPLVALLLECISGSRALSWFLVEVGAAIKVASTTVLAFRSKRAGSVAR